MNVTDVKKNAPPHILDDPSSSPLNDRLGNMFMRQLGLEEKYRVIEGEVNNFFPQFKADNFPLDIDSHDTQAFMKDAFERIIEELMEAANCLKNKPWKQTQVVTDQQHFDEELMDSLHFFIRLALIRWGPDAAEIMYQMYFKKSEVNLFRQESKY